MRGRRASALVVVLMAVALGLFLATRGITHRVDVTSSNPPLPRPTESPFPGEVPDVVGLSLDEAKTVLRSVGYTQVEVREIGANGDHAVQATEPAAHYAASPTDVIVVIVGQ
jgi:hypothetical protein